MLLAGNDRFKPYGVAFLGMSLPHVTGQQKRSAACALDDKTPRREGRGKAAHGTQARPMLVPREPWLMLLLRLVLSLLRTVIAEKSGAEKSATVRTSGAWQLSPDDNRSCLCLAVRRDSLSWPQATK